jgi:hypothetical protein
LSELTDKVASEEGRRQAAPAGIAQVEVTRARLFRKISRDRIDLWPTFSADRS